MADPKKRSFDPYNRVKIVAKVIGAVLLYRAFQWWSSPQKAAEQIAAEIVETGIRGGIILGASTGIIYGMECLADYLNIKENDPSHDAFDQNNVDPTITPNANRQVGSIKPAHANHNDLRRRVLKLK